MQIKNEINEVLHRIRVKLYPNHFQHVEGAYIARTDSEASLNVKQVCTTAISRGGVECDLDDFMEYIDKYNEEVAYQLCDGYAVNNGGTLRVSHLFLVSVTATRCLSLPSFCLL